MLNNFTKCLAFILSEEGEFSNNPDDPGGATMEGITLAVYRTWRHDQSLTADDLIRITPREVSSIYKQNYWVVIQGDALNGGVDLMVVDMAVNAGSHSAKILQATIGVKVDGMVGPITLAAANALDRMTLIRALAANQRKFYRSLPTFSEFGTGWLNRVAARYATASRMINRKLMATKVTVSPPHDFYTRIRSLV